MHVSYKPLKTNKKKNSNKQNSTSQVQTVWTLCNTVQPSEQSAWHGSSTQWQLVTSNKN